MNKQTDYMLLINHDYPLPENFEATVQLVEAENSEGDRLLIEKKTYDAFLRLRQDILENHGLQIELISVYRTIPQQQDTWNNYLEKFGLEHTKKYVAVPGHSEHHTGMAIDVSIVVDGNIVRGAKNLLKIDRLFKPIQAKLPAYGFILRYPKGKEDITKINYEPWHFRYLDDPALAKDITDRGLCFEEYWEEKAK